MTLSQLISQIKNYRQLLNRKSKTIGSIIKHHRGETRLTLQETAEGICSVSYLCKVENNQLIPSESILPKIIERLKIKEDELKAVYNSDWITTIIEANYVADEIISNYKNRNDYQSKLINYAKLILNQKDYIKAYQQFLDLTKYLSHFKEEEMCFFLYLYIIKCDKKERYTDVLKLSKEVMQFRKKDQVLIKVRLKEFKAINKLSMTSQISLYYENTIKILVEYNKFSLVNYVRTYHLSYLAKSLKTRELENEINKLNNLTDEAIHYIYFTHHFYQRNDYLSAYYQINKIKNLNDHYFIMTIITLYKLKKVDKINEVIANFNLPLRNSYEDIIGFITSSEDFRIDFIRSRILTNKTTGEEKMVNDFLYNESYELLKRKYLYKESSLILEKHNRILNQALGINIK